MAFELDYEDHDHDDHDHDDHDDHDHSEDEWSTAETWGYATLANTFLGTLVQSIKET